jgi:hypothetical protein
MGERLGGEENSLGIFTRECGVRVVLSKFVYAILVQHNENMVEDK